MFSVPFSWPTPTFRNSDGLVQCPHCSDEHIKLEEKREFVKDKLVKRSRFLATWSSTLVSYAKGLSLDYVGLPITSSEGSCLIMSNF